MMNKNNLSYNRTLSEVSSFSSLLTCSSCQTSLGSDGAFTQGNCDHPLCSHCYKECHQCPRCGESVQPNKFRESKTLQQIASSVSNIQALIMKLQNNVEDDENDESTKVCDKEVEKNAEKPGASEKKTESKSKTKTRKVLNNVGVAEKKNSKGETALHVACSRGRVDLVLDLLGEGCNPNTRDNAGWTPLHEAAGHGLAPLAETLLKHGANPNVPSSEERITPLHDAVSNKDVEMIKLLISYGADKEARDRYGNTPLALAGDDVDVMRAVEDTEVLHDLNETVKTVHVTHHELVLCFSKKIKSLRIKKMLETSQASKLGFSKTVKELSAGVTHYIVDEDEEVTPGSFAYLAALGGYFI